MGPASPHQSWSARQATRRGKPFDPITSGSKPAEQSIDSRATHNVHRSPRWGGWSHCRQADKPTGNSRLGGISPSATVPASQALAALCFHLFWYEGPRSRRRDMDRLLRRPNPGGSPVRVHQAMGVSSWQSLAPNQRDKPPRVCSRHSAPRAAFEAHPPPASAPALCSTRWRRSGQRLHASELRSAPRWPVSAASRPLA